MNVFTHVDDQPIVSDNLPEYMDILRDNEEKDSEDQRTSANSEARDDMASWLASDEAAFWMGM